MDVGYCYLSLVRESCQRLAREECGAWPTLRSVFSQASAWFRPQVLTARVRQVGPGLYHVDETGVCTLDDAFASCSAACFEWPSGSLGEYVASELSRAGALGRCALVNFTVDSRLGGERGQQMAGLGVVGVGALQPPMAPVQCGVSEVPPDVLKAYYQAYSAYLQAVIRVAELDSASASDSPVASLVSVGSAGSEPSVNSSASSGRAAARARWRANKKKRGLLLSAKSSVAASVSSAVASVVPDEVSCGESLQRKVPLMPVADGFCYLATVRLECWDLARSRLFAWPSMVQLLSCPAEWFECDEVLAALRVVVRGSTAHVLSACSAMVGATRFLTLCRGADAGNFSPGSLAARAGLYARATCSFVNDADFRVGGMTNAFPVVAVDSTVVGARRVRLVMDRAECLVAARMTWCKAGVSTYLSLQGEPRLVELEDNGNLSLRSYQCADMEAGTTAHYDGKAILVSGQYLFGSCKVDATQVQVGVEIVGDITCVESGSIVMVPGAFEFVRPVSNVHGMQLALLPDYTWEVGWPATLHSVPALVFERGRGRDRGDGGMQWRVPVVRGNPRQIYGTMWEGATYVRAPPNVKLKFGCFSGRGIEVIASRGWLNSGALGMVLSCGDRGLVTVVSVSDQETWDYAYESDFGLAMSDLEVSSGNDD